MRDALTLNPEELRTGIGHAGPSPDFDLECVFCGQRYQAGVIYRDGELLQDAPRAARRHVQSAHGGPFVALLAQGKEVHGLSDVQQRLLRLAYEGLSDQAVAQELGGRAESTVRNHRFQLRRQGRALDVLLALLEDEARPTPAPTGSGYVEFHAGLPVSDDRTVVTEAEYEAVLARFFEDEERTRLVRFPKKQKHKLIVLRQLARQLAPDRQYAESEINRYLMSAYDDYVTLRRYLVEYRFLDRHADGSAYWRIDVRS